MPLPLVGTEGGADERHIEMVHMNKISGANASTSVGRRGLDTASYEGQVLQ